MGWKGYESKIPVGMILRKMYCHRCGVQLKIEKLSNIYQKGDNEYSNKILGHSTLGMDKLEQVCYIYRCPNCNTKITYEDQCLVAKKQKEYNKIIFDE